MVPTRLDTIEALSDPQALEPVLGAISALHSEPSGSLGFSGSTHSRIQVQLQSGGQRGLVLKHVDLGLAWTAYRTGDAVGREAALLAEPDLQGIWQVFSCPYLAYAVEEEEVGLLMADLSHDLFPDVDAPLSPEEEDGLLSTLAAMHARYWQADATDLPWLASPSQLFNVLGPRAGEQELARGVCHPLFELVARGWNMALAGLPKDVRELLERPVHELVKPLADLPRTILHGDAKVANFALGGDGGVAAFDWAWLGTGPCSFDLGWYLAVNSRRLARSREDVIARYRAFLEAGLGNRLPDALWEQFLRAGILCGAIMLLWEKARSLESGSQLALQEWNWWVERLKDCV